MDGWDPLRGNDPTARNLKSLWEAIGGAPIILLDVSTLNASKLARTKRLQNTTRLFLKSG
jgi:hypothetical protein